MRTCKKGAKDETREEIRNASQECKAERDADEEAFNATYGTEQERQERLWQVRLLEVRGRVEADVEAFENAAKECKAERAEDPEAFTATYGTNKNGKNAFGKCVSSKSDEGDDEPPPRRPRPGREPPSGISWSTPDVSAPPWPPMLEDEGARRQRAGGRLRVWGGSRAALEIGRTTPRSGRRPGPQAASVRPRRSGAG